MKLIAREALIKGVFTPDEAKEVLTTLFRSKIQMHSLSSFSSYIKTGTESHVDNSRKQELTESLEKLVKSIKEHTDPEIEVKLDCQVKMQFVKKKRNKK